MSEASRKPRGFEASSSKWYEMDSIDISSSLATVEASSSLEFSESTITVPSGGADKKLDTPVSGLESACTRWRPGSSPWRPSRRGSA